MSQPPERFYNSISFGLSDAKTCSSECFSVGDVITDPPPGAPPTEHERIRATVEIERLADEEGLGAVRTGVFAVTEDFGGSGWRHSGGASTRRWRSCAPA